LATCRLFSTSTHFFLASLFITKPLCPPLFYARSRPFSSRRILLTLWLLVLPRQIRPLRYHLISFHFVVIALVLLLFVVALCFLFFLFVFTARAELKLFEPNSPGTYDRLQWQQPQGFNLCLDLHLIVHYDLPPRSSYLFECYSPH